MKWAIVKVYRVGLESTGRPGVWQGQLVSQRRPDQPLPPSRTSIPRQKSDIVGVVGQSLVGLQYLNSRVLYSSRSSLYLQVGLQYLDSRVLCIVVIVG